MFCIEHCRGRNADIHLYLISHSVLLKFIKIVFIELKLVVQFTVITNNKVVNIKIILSCIISYSCHFNFMTLCTGVAKSILILSVVFDTGQRHTKAIIKTVTDAPLPQYKGRSGISLLSLKNSDGHYLE